MGQINQDEHTTGNWITDRVLRGVIWLILRLPYRMRLSAFSAIIRRVISPLAGYRKRALKQLAYIYPDMTPTRRQEIANGVANNMGRTLIENYSGDEFAQSVAHQPINGVGYAAVKAAQDSGRPVIFFTGHFGNYEAPRRALTAAGFTIGALYRPMSNPFFNAHYAKTIAQVSGPVFAQGARGTMGFARHIKSGGMAVLLFDIWDRGGITVPFLGKPAPTATSAADFAIRFDALLVPYFGTRQPDGVTMEVEIGAPIAHTTAAEMVMQMTQCLEVKIKSHPEQWFWFHRRWKPHRKV